MRHWRLAFWIAMALASTSTRARADEASAPSEVGASWVGAVHVALPTSGRDGCWKLSLPGLDDSLSPSRPVEGVVKIDGGAMHYAFDPSRDVRQIVTSEFGPGSLASLFGRLDPPPVMAVTLGGGRTATVSLGFDGGGSVAVRDCPGVDGLAADNH